MALSGFKSVSLVVACTAALGLSGCGVTATDVAADTTATPAAAPQVDAVDVGFARALITHDRQGALVSAMASTRAVSAQVKAVASAILAADEPCIATLTGWLKAWGKPVPAGDASGDSAAEDGSAPASADEPDPGVPGMLDAEQVVELGNGSGRAWDIEFLQAMVTSQTGELAVAKAELAGGGNPDARALAQQIVAADSTQISQIQRILVRSPA